MGAVCMEKQMKKKGEKGKAKDKRVKQEELLKGDSGQELEAILGSLPRKELENLLLSAAEENESFRNRLLVRYGQADEGLIQDLEKELRGIRKGYSYGRKKSGYGEKEDFFYDMQEFLYDRVHPLIDKGNFSAAFKLVRQSLEELGEMRPGEEEEDLEELWEICYEFWKEILEKLPDHERWQMFGWFQRHQKSSASSYAENCIWIFYINEFRESGMLKEKLRLLDQEIQKEEERESSQESEASQERTADLVLRRVQFMKEAGEEPEEILRYMERYRRFSAVREKEVREYESLGEYEKGISLLKESKLLAYEHPGLMAKYSRWLLKLYRKTGDLENYKEELLYQVFQCTQHNLENLQLLKKVCGREEWEGMREKILRSDTVSMIRCAFLEEEGMHRQLLEEIVSRGSAILLEQYEKILGEKFPEEIRDFYIAYVEKVSLQAGKRNQYRNLVRYLKKIAAYPRGKEAAMEIASRWYREYKSRTAMLDELKKAGFKGREQKIVQFP